MNILKLYPLTDNPQRFNFNINYGVWRAIQGDEVVMERFKGDTSAWDFVFLPQYKRWQGYYPLLDKIKNGKAKAILFDNDSCYNSFRSDFYSGIDFVFYRDKDKYNSTPSCKSQWLKWSIDTTLYTPVYGGEGIAFNCATAAYPLRKKIKSYLKNTRYKGSAYIRLLQHSAAAIHTNNELCELPRAKILEYAACGTQIISNRMKYMDSYFPDRLINYFNSIGELKRIIKSFKPDESTQRELREIVEEKHDDTIRAIEVLNVLNSL